MRLVIQGDKIAAQVGDDYVGDELTVPMPDGFDITRAHKHRHDGNQIVRRVPYKVTRRQGVQALILAEKIQLVQPAIDAIADPLQRALALAYWDDSQEFERSHPMLAQVATMIGLDAAALDTLFITADDL